MEGGSKKFGCLEAMGVVWGKGHGLLEGCRLRAAQLQAGSLSVLFKVSSHGYMKAVAIVKGKHHIAC